MITRTINGITFDINPRKSSSIICDSDVAQFINKDLSLFFDYLYEQKKEYTPMVTTWEITDKCNFNCPFCYIHNNSVKCDNLPSIERILQDIDYMVSRGLLMVYLTGGEVLTYSDFERLYRYLKDSGVFVVLLTNLSLLCSSHIELFKELPPYRITTTIYGLTKSQFEQATGVTNIEPSLILKNIEQLHNLGINITCQMPVNKLTLSDYLDIGEWCYERGIKFNSSNGLYSSYSGISRDEFQVDDETFKLLKEQVKRASVITSPADSPKNKFGFKHHFDCTSGKHTFVISYDYKLRPCFAIYGDNAKSFNATNSIAQAFKQMEKYLNEYKKQVIDYCEGCNAVDICSECLYTQTDKDNLKTYMINICKKNQGTFAELLNSTTT